MGKPNLPPSTRGGITSAKTLGGQLAAILALSTALGLCYNASNPIGIRWSAPVATKPLPAPPASAPAVRTQAVALPPAVNPLVTGATVPAATTSAGSAALSEPVTAAVPTYTPPSPTTGAETKPVLAKSQVVLVDARSKAQYDAAHIPGAVSLPEASSPNEVATFRKQHPADRRFVIYCGSAGCVEAFRLANCLLREHGYTSVQFMTEGYTDWRRAEQSSAGPHSRK